MKNLIVNLQHPLVKHLVRLREKSDYRKKTGSVLVSGSVLIKELATFVSPYTLLLAEAARAHQLPLFPNTRIYHISEAVLKKITALPSPEALVAEFPLPLPSCLEGRWPLLVVEAIRDPGNLGTLLRTALAFGWQGVFFLPQCVDPFHEKLMRSSRGALFRLPWYVGSWEELEALQQKGQLVAYLADPRGKKVEGRRLTERALLLLSNEAQGLSEKARSWIEKGAKVQALAISMEGEMESLNVAIAGSILMYLMSRGDGRREDR